LEADVADAEAVIASPIYVDRDRRGKPRYTGRIRGVRVRVVVALDEPDLIVTIHKRER
jgi:mRNA-degrading endonuclease RelE of RelBE toxin-antitoxin system